MRSPEHELEKTVYRFNLGFHWTTILGMLGVILLVFGIQSLIKKEECIMASAVFTLFIIQMSTWDYLLFSSRTYMRLAWKLDDQIIWIYYALLCGAILFTIILFAAMFVRQMNEKANLFYRVAAVLAFLCLSGCLIFKTICNQWYLVQAFLAVFLVICLFGERLRYRQYKKKEETAQADVLGKKVNQ